MRFLELLLRFLSRFRSHVFYVNGPVSLPAPLSPAEEQSLIARLPAEDARQSLIEHNLRLVAYIARKFDNSNTDIEDLISIGTIGLIKAVTTFRADKQIKLATYASRCIENEILMFLRKLSSQKSTVSLDEPLNTDCDGNELMLSDLLGTDSDDVSQALEEREERKIIFRALNKLPERDRRIILLRFGFNGDGQEKTQKEVADALGISQSYISRLEKRIIARLREELNKLTY